MAAKESQVLTGSGNCARLGASKMPNKNYQAGRRLEYETVKRYRNQGCHAMRTAGSHGFFDVIALYDDMTPTLIQCKRVSRAAEGHRLADNFIHHPPLKMSGKYRQQLIVQIKGSRELIVETV